MVTRLSHSEPAVLTTIEQLTGLLRPDSVTRVRKRLTMPKSYCKQCGCRLGFWGGRFVSDADPSFCRDCEFISAQNEIQKNQTDGQEKLPSPNISLRQLVDIPLMFIGPAIFMAMLWPYLCGRFWTDRDWDEYRSSDWIRGAFTAIALLTLFLLIVNYLPAEPLDRFPRQ